MTLARTVVTTPTGRAVGGVDRLAAVTAGAVVALGTAIVVQPSIAGVLPPCPVHAATGLDCPGCGMTRAVQALARGDVGAAIGHNAVLMLVLVPLLVVVWLARLRQRPMPGILAHRWFMPLFVGVVATFAVLRNIPVAPFRALAAGSP